MNRSTCQCCNMPRAELKNYKSKLINMKLIMCATCIDSKFEPRFVIILTARSKGIEAVKEYINKHRYVGDPIHAKDIVI